VVRNRDPRFLAPENAWGDCQLSAHQARQRSWLHNRYRQSAIEGMTRALAVDYGRVAFSAML